MLSLLAARRRRWLPPAGTRWRVAFAGLLLVGGYSVFYLLALDHGMTPGVLATVMGVQPLLTLVLTEMRVHWSAGLALSVGWLALAISVAATLLFYRLIQTGNLVNVTSLFYLVPAGTALLDWAVLGNVLAPAAISGMACIVGGLAVAYRVNTAAPPVPRCGIR